MMFHLDPLHLQLASFCYPSGSFSANSGWQWMPAHFELGNTGCDCAAMAILSELCKLSFHLNKIRRGVR